MGSDSDLPVMQGAIDVLIEFDVPYEARIVSAHRTPDVMVTYARTAAERGLQVIIAGAGGAAHLPGMTASMTPLPVIGVPVPLERLDGLDSLLSIVQMPKGIPVATVAVGNATNAGLLAVRILGAADTAAPRPHGRVPGHARRARHREGRRAPRAEPLAPILAPRLAARVPERGGAPPEGGAPRMLQPSCAITSCSKWSTASTLLRRRTARSCRDRPMACDCSPSSRSRARSSR